MKCLSCGKAIKKKDAVCPHCGEKIERTELTKIQKIVRIISIVIFFLAIFMFVMGGWSLWMVTTILVLIDFGLVFALKGIPKSARIWIILALAIVVFRFFMGGF